MLPGRLITARDGRTEVKNGAGEGNRTRVTARGSTPRCFGCMIGVSKLLRFRFSAAVTTTLRLSGGLRVRLPPATRQAFAREVIGLTAVSHW